MFCLVAWVPPLLLAVELVLLWPGKCTWDDAELNNALRVPS